MPVRHAVFITVAAFFTLVACARRPRTCDPVPARYTADGPVYPACAVERQARLSTAARRYPTNFRPTQPCGRVVVEFVVDTNGVPIRETAHVVRSNDTQLQLMMLETLTELHYAPAIRNGARVRQLTTFEQGYSVTVVSAGTPASVARSQARRSC